MKMAFVKSAVVAAVAVMAMGANAQSLTNNMGDVSVGYSLTNLTAKVKGSFADTWSFHVTEPLYSFGVLTNMVTGANFLNITELTVKLYGGSVGSGVLIDDLADNSGSVPGLIFSGSGQYIPGNYYFEVKGNASGTSGGAYVFSATTAPLAPVPEPETYAMLLAGLGVMGAIAARRRNKSKGD